MNTRVDIVVHAPPHLRVEMSLREASALGRVLSTVEGRRAADVRARFLGEGLLRHCGLWAMTEAVGYAEAVEATADPETDHGRLALRLAQQIRAAVVAARNAGESTR